MSVSESENPAIPAPEPKMGKMLSNRGSIGVLISWMKRIISRYEPAEDYAEDDAAVQAILDAAKKLRPEK